MYFKKGKDIRKRIKIMAALPLTIMVFLMCRLFYIQYYNCDKYKTIANEQYYYKENTSNMSYKVFDRNGQSAKLCERKYIVKIKIHSFLSLNNFDQCTKSVDRLRDLLLSCNYILNKESLAKETDDTKCINVNEKVYEEVNKIRDLKGVYAYYIDNYYKEKNSNIVNVLCSEKIYKDNKTLKDKGTIEREIYEYTKDNKVPSMIFEKDVDGYIVRNFVDNIGGNKNVVLTLDNNIQKLSEDVIRDENKTYSKYNQIGVVLMDSESGEILSMALKDDYGENINIGIPSSGILLGSVFKTIIYEGALEEGIIKTSDDMLPNINKIFFKDSMWRERLQCSVEEAYNKSYNNFFGNLGNILGINNIYKFSEKNGLFSKVLNLQDEHCGEYETMATADNREYFIAKTSIGQAIRTTPLAALSIPSVIVNGGTYVKPYIVKSIIDENNNIVKNFGTEKHYVISKDNAEVIKKNMIGVVESKEGTGNASKVDGIECGGKTGTTEWSSKDKDGKLVNYCDRWFTGFFKIDNKYYCMVVVTPTIVNKEDVSDESTKIIFKKIVEGIIEKSFLK